MSPASPSAPGTPTGSSDARATASGGLPLPAETRTRMSLRYTGAPCESSSRKETRTGPGA